MRTFMVLMIAAAATTACGSTGEPVEPGRVYHAQAGDTVELRTGESVLLGNGGARVTFTRIVTDSRCPVDVTCVWAGDAHIQLAATPSAIPEETLDLHTGIDPIEAEFAGFTIRLIDVSPQRSQSDDVEPGDYSVRLAISRG